MQLEEYRIALFSAVGFVGVWFVKANLDAALKAANMDRLLLRLIAQKWFWPAVSVFAAGVIGSCTTLLLTFWLGIVPA